LANRLDNRRLDLGRRDPRDTACLILAALQKGVGHIIAIANAGLV
jgi:hypothetical protein